MVRLSSIFLVLALQSCGAGQTATLPSCAAPGRGDSLQFPLRRAGACLVDARGAPVWLHGEAAWSLLVRLTDDEVDRYLADRRARGVNALLVNLLEHKFADHAPANRAGDQPFLAPGAFTAPGEPYFAHVDRVLARAARAGMVVLLAPAYLGYQGGDEGWYAEVRRAGPAAMRAYGQFLGARFRAAPNLIWVQGGDTPPMAVGAEVDALVAGIREADPVHLHTAHSTRRRAALDDYDRPWLDLDTVYSDCDHHADQLRDGARRRRNLPTIFLEGTYEGEDASLACTVSQAYRTLLSGAAGHVFGNRPIWLFDPGWPSALDSPGSRAMQHLAALVAARDLRGLVPDFDRALVSADGVAVARAPSGTTLVFVDGGSRTLRIFPAGVARRRVTWFYPATGATILAGSIDARRVVELASPPHGPWLLLLDDKPAGVRSDVLPRKLGGYGVDFSSTRMPFVSGRQSPAAMKAAQ